MTTSKAVELVRKMAKNNAWANLRLHRAISALDDAEYRKARTSFFPSLHLTLAHILFVDRYYLGVLCAEQVNAAALWAELEQWEQKKGHADVVHAQREVDERLCHFVDELREDADLEVEVRLPRQDRIQVERREDVLLHLFQHQIHHRGQVHAMLSGTAVKPPQLDDFFLSGDLPLREAELRELGWPLR